MLSGSRRLSATPILLVGNYLPDRQVSMQRYGELVERALRLLEVPARLVRPEPILSRWCPARSRVFRWAGFIDKLVLFPLRLLWIVHRPGGATPSSTSLIRAMVSTFP